MENLEYIEFIQCKSCVICGEPGPNHAHHVSVSGEVMGGKVSDYNTVPLCNPCHGLVEGFLLWKAEEFFRYIIKYNQEWIERRK